MSSPARRTSPAGPAAGASRWPPPRSCADAGGRRWPFGSFAGVPDRSLRRACVDVQRIAKAVRDERFARRYTREQFCELTGLALNSVKDLENGNRWPSAQTLWTVLDHLGFRLETRRR